MGTIAARRAGEGVTDVARILAIELMCVGQAIELRQRDGGPPFGPAALATLAMARAYSPFLDEDRPLSAEIEAIAAALLDGGLAAYACNEGLEDMLDAF